MTNELDEIVALEERWVRHGGPMTFSEFEAWEWDWMLQDAYLEDWRRTAGAVLSGDGPNVIRNGWSGSETMCPPVYFFDPVPPPKPVPPPLMDVW